MFNAEAIIEVLRNAMIQTEADTTRALADVIRKLPAGYPPSEIADTLDALASELSNTDAARPSNVVNLHTLRAHDQTRVGCPLCLDPIRSGEDIATLHDHPEAPMHAECLDDYGVDHARAIIHQERPNQ